MKSHLKNKVNLINKNEKALLHRQQWPKHCTRNFPFFLLLNKWRLATAGEEGKEGRKIGWGWGANQEFSCERSMHMVIIL